MIPYHGISPWNENKQQRTLIQCDLVKKPSHIFRQAQYD